MEFDSCQRIVGKKLFSLFIAVFMFGTLPVFSGLLLVCFKGFSA